MEAFKEVGKQVWREDGEADGEGDVWGCRGRQIFANRRGASEGTKTTDSSILDCQPPDPWEKAQICCLSLPVSGTFLLAWGDLMKLHKVQVFFFKLLCASLLQKEYYVRRYCCKCLWFAHVNINGFTFHGHRVGVRGLTTGVRVFLLFLSCDDW